MKVNVRSIYGSKESLGTKWDIREKIENIYTPYPLKKVTIYIYI